ncbi:BH3 interacting domain death agonist [Polymixia lowei]
MDVFGDGPSGPGACLVFLSFLHQSDCGSVEFQQELDSLSRELHLTRDINSNSPWVDTFEDGKLETDGHFPSSISGSFGDIQPQVNLEWAVNPEEAETLREVTVGLREIADQLECSVVARATDNLARKLLNAPFHRWKDHLTLEVEWVVKQGLGYRLEHLPQEKVIVVITLTLVKGVCKLAPRLLRSLFNTALQYISTTVAS